MLFEFPEYIKISLNAFSDEKVAISFRLIFPSSSDRYKKISESNSSTNATSTCFEISSALLLVL